MKESAANPFYEGILDVTEEDLVSTDLKGNSHSAVVDLSLTDVIGGNLIKVIAWYDNEWGYSNRLVELTADFGKMTKPENENESPENNPPEQSEPEQENEKDAPQEVISGDGDGRGPHFASLRENGEGKSPTGPESSTPEYNQEHQ
jgi:hypothetical protein